MVPFSVLDLAPIVQGGDAGTALRNSRDLAVHVESWGYRRIWLAEHHNMPGVASAATAVVIAHVAAGTSSIRVGAGGIMLPNHAPLVIAEQFGTLASLFPGRVDLAVGRAPGTDPRTAHALRRTRTGGSDAFPDDVVELLGYLGAADPDEPVRAVPGTGTNVPVWILGSSLYGAQLAAALGLPYAFASHFAPALLVPAIEVYRRNFKPSPWLARPHLMLAANLIAADTDAEARLLLTSLQQTFVQLRRGRPVPMPPPREGFEAELSAQERAMLDETFACSFVGSADTVRRGIEAFVARTEPDELILSSHIFDHAARLGSYRIAAELFGRAESA